MNKQLERTCASRTHGSGKTRKTQLWMDESELESLRFCLRKQLDILGVLTLEDGKGKEYVRDLKKIVSSLPDQHTCLSDDERKAVQDK